MMNNNLQLKLAIKAFLIWLALSLAGFFWGEHLIKVLTPFYGEVIEQIDSNYQTHVFINNEAEKKVVLAATALRAIPIVADKSLPAGRTIESNGTVLHALVPLVILLTVILVFPLQNFKQRIFLAVLTMPAILFVSALTVPLQLLGNLEVGYMNALAKYGYTKDAPWALEWMLLTEGGGRWLIPVLTGIGCGGVARKLFVD